MNMNKISGVHNLAERKVKHLSIKTVVHLHVSWILQDIIAAEETLIIDVDE